MKGRLKGLCAAAVVAGTAGAQQDALDRPYRVEADGKPISVEIGHAAPWMHDWDGDGKADLLVGQFGSGKLRVYRNVGEAGAPKFKDFVFAQAGGADATVPSG